MRPHPQLCRPAELPPPSPCGACRCCPSVLQAAGQISLRLLPAGCAEGEEGAKLEKEAADETWGLQPRHTTVPHILVNGVPIWDDFERLQRYVCAATSGRRPAKCFAKPA